MPSMQPPTGDTPLGDAVASLHEMFLTLVKAGFTEWQACTILGTMLAAQGRKE